MKPQNKEVDFTFYPTKDFKECPVCGICSFPHIHRKGTLPKDFERIEPENKCKHEFTVKGKNCLKCGMPILNMTDYEKWEREEEDYEWDIKPENKSTNEGHPVKNYCRVCHKETEQIFNIHGTPAYICPDCESLIVKQSVVYNYSNKQND